MGVPYYNTCMMSRDLLTLMFPSKDFFSPVNAFVSGLLGDEMFRRALGGGGEVENEKCFYLGQYLELENF